MANHTTGGRPRGHPPTAVQCALAVVTAGLAVAAVMLALVETAQANYLTPLPQDEPYLQSPVSTMSYPQPASPASPPPAKPSCPPTLPATYSGSLRLLGQTPTNPSTLTATINGQPWATTTIADVRYQIDVQSILAFVPNGLTSPDNAIEGMVLILPKAVPPPPTGTATSPTPTATPAAPTPIP